MPILSDYKQALSTGGKNLRCQRWIVTCLREVICPFQISQGHQDSNDAFRHCSPTSAPWGYFLSHLCHLYVHLKVGIHQSTVLISDCIRVRLTTTIKMLMSHPHFLFKSATAAPITTLPWLKYRVTVEHYVFGTPASNMMHSPTVRVGPTETSGHCTKTSKENQACRSQQQLQTPEWICTWLRTLTCPMRIASFLRRLASIDTLSLMRVAAAHTSPLVGEDSKKKERVRCLTPWRNAKGPLSNTMKRTLSRSAPCLV